MVECRACFKTLRDAQALKAHAWCKATCREALPTHLKNELAEWDAEARSHTRCPTCDVRLKNLEEALKAHAWAKKSCRAALPQRMRDDIEEEEQYMRNHTPAPTCPGCSKRSADNADAMPVHASHKRSCRRGLSVEKQNALLDILGWARREEEDEEEVAKCGHISSRVCELARICGGQHSVARAQSSPLSRPSPDTAGSATPEGTIGSAFPTRPDCGTTGPIRSAPVQCPPAQAEAMWVNETIDILIERFRLLRVLHGIRG